MSIASQLQAIKSVIRGKEDPIKRPITRPSILFGAKEAADIDIKSILPLALSGLDALVTLDERFSIYKATLFSHATLDIDREKMVPKEEEKLNKSISSYLQLLAGHLNLPAAHRTLEYLIRRYQVHVYNSEELLLSALPYHDTYVFVRIIQLIDFGNNKWAFLEGVKASGAPPPRKIIVQQCIRDKGVLEALCNYASPTKHFQQSRPVVCFSTAVIVEALGSIAKLDTDTVQKVLNFVFSGLNPAFGGSRDHMAGALMVVGIIATRATLGSKLVQNLVFFIARLAQHETQKSLDLPWLRVTIMAIVTLVQDAVSGEQNLAKHMPTFGDKVDFIGVLSELSKEFNVQKFLYLLIESLIDCSSVDDSYYHVLVNVIETFLIKDFVERIVHKVLTRCMKYLHAEVDSSDLFVAGKQAKELLALLEKQYPSELQGALQKFLVNSKIKLGEEESTFMVFCRMLDGNSDMPFEVSDSKVWLSLEHPKAAVRRATLLDMASSGLSKSIVAYPWKLVNVKDALLRCLKDDDLGVVQAALTINGLSEIIDPPVLLKAYNEVLFRCIDIMAKSAERSSQACDVAVLCLDHMVLDTSLQRYNMVKEVAGIIFPLLVILPQTWRVNVKALDIVKQLQWPYYFDIMSCDSDFAKRQGKRIEDGQIVDINIRTIRSLAESLVTNPNDYIEWLIACCKHNKIAKCLLFFVILQAFIICKDEIASLWRLYDVCSAILKCEWYNYSSIYDGVYTEKFLKEDWCEVETHGMITIANELNLECFDKSYRRLASQLLHADANALSNKILICIYWCLLEICNATAINNWAEGEQLLLLNELFLFFASSSVSIFKKQLPSVVRSCKAPFQFLGKFFIEEGFAAEVQLESLFSFASICSIYVSNRNYANESAYMSLLMFPSLLIPLSSADKEIRTAAVSCVEGIYMLWPSYDSSQLMNGDNEMFLRCVSSPNFGEFLKAIFNQKKLISSDGGFFPSFLTSLLSSSSDSLLVPENIHKRFDLSTKDAILSFILSTSLKLPSFGKLKVLSLLKTMGNTLLKMECCKDLLVELLQKRKEYLSNVEKLHEGLLECEIETLCLLLEFCVPHSYPGNLDAVGIDCLLKALNVDGLLLDEPVVEKPCVTVLKNLNCSFYDNLNSGIQDKIFLSLVYLFQCDSGVIRNAAREALLKLDISSSTIHSLLDGILSQDLHSASSKRIKKNKSMTILRYYSMDACGSDGIIIHILGSLLDIILLKKDFNDRVSLVQPLFKVLGKLFSRDHLLSFLNYGRAGEFVSEISESLSAAIQHAQQSTLLVLKNIVDCLNMGDSEKDELCSKLDISLLVECACSAMDFATRNSIFILLSSIAKISSGWLSEHIIDLFAIVGESAAMQGDNHSQHVLENLISTLVPCWLSKTNSVGKLFKIFMKDLPNMADHRRLSLIVFLLRTLGEMDNLGILYYNLFHSLTFRLLNSSSGFETNLHELISPSSMIFLEWEYTFALKLCDQYSGKVWFSCLVKLLQEIEHKSMQQELLLDLYLTMQFMHEKLMDTCLVFELESGNDADFLQSVLGELMEQLILHLQTVGVRCKQLGISRNILREIKNCIARVIGTLRLWMKPDTFFKSIVQLLGKGDGDAMKKTLGFLCEYVKEQGPVKGREMEIAKRQRKASFFPVKVTGHVVTSFNELCSKINQLISSPSMDTRLKLSAISTIEVLAKEFHCDEPIFGSCLQTVVGEIDSSDLALSSACIRSTAALVGVLGSHALKQLPCIVEKVFGKVHELLRFPSKKSKQRTDGFESYKASLLLSILSALEAMITNLSGFLNPYLDTIIVIIVHPDCALHPEAKINTRAATVRKLLTEKIPVRLILPPLLKVDEAVLRCHTSLSFVFEMLANLVSRMDRTSIGSYYVKIYEKCLASLDIRRQVPDSVNEVNLVEQTIIQAMVVLTMKLTEAMFRPLFLHSLEWAESELEENQSIKSISIDRSISFYNFVNKLIQKHRSLFVPYFKYLLESCIRYLSEDQTLDLNPLHEKRKKAKIADPQTHIKAVVILPTKLWHVRALVLKALYQCFLYDTTETKLLDASNFQVLLKPIISQLVVEPPSSLNDHPDLPSVEDVDESLVSCLGQMAVTARSDVLWKPLNHEVLMQTRNDKIRPKMLGLRVVRYLLEHLREEYLVFLPETIPFLGELLEDVELPVKTLAQEILKEMEVLSGESLKQYL